MAPKSPSQRPARTPRPSLKERLLAARTESTIEKPRKRAAKEENSAASKKRRTASHDVEEQEEPAIYQSNEAESSTDHDLVSSDHDDEDAEDLEDLVAPEEPVPQPDEKDYDTDDDLYYASESDGELEERIQSFHYEYALVWRIEDQNRPDGAV